MAAPIVLDLLLDDDHELVIENGDWVMAADQVGIKQLVKVALLFFATEWFLDLELGIDYWNKVYIKNPNLILVREIFRRAIAESPGILEVTRMALNYVGARIVQIDWQAQSDLGILRSTDRSI